MEAVLAGCFLDELPERLIGDKAYDSDALDQTLVEEYGVEMIVIVPLSYFLIERPAMRIGRSLSQRAKERESSRIYVSEITLYSQVERVNGN